MIARPDSEAKLADLVAEAAGAGTSVVIKGGGTRSPVQGDPAHLSLETGGLTGVTLYEPSEMVISARAGTPLETVRATLAEKGQMLAFDPMDHRRVLGTSGTPTIGAVAACNISGSRRVAAGAARDHLIGIRMVNGQGEIIRSGGRVMKNVTGLDLVKLNAGAMGTLGVLTEVTFKVLPFPETRVTLCLEGLAPRTALDAMTEAMATPFEVTSAAYLADAPSRTAFRLEGFADSCQYRFDRLAHILSRFAPAQEIVGSQEAELWTRVRDAHDFADAAQVMRVHVAPSRAGQVVELAETQEMAFMIDWAGGLIWLGFSSSDDLAGMMERIGALGGHPRLLRATRPAPALLPAPPVLQALSARVKRAFDPKNIFNPGLLASPI